MNKTLTRIYLVRHGESESNAGINLNISSEQGTPLTEKGQKQAADLAEKLKDIDFDAIFSSDLTRAVQTAEIIKLERDLIVKTNKTIRERAIRGYLDKYPGKSRQQLESELQKALEHLDNKKKLDYKHTPDMESAGEGVSRLLTFLREIAVAYRGKTVLVTNHGNIIRSALVHLGWAEYDELPDGSIDNTGYVVLDSDGIDFFIQEVQGAYKKSGVKRGW